MVEINISLSQEGLFFCTILFLCAGLYIIYSLYIIKIEIEKIRLENTLIKKKIENINKNVENKNIKNKRKRDRSKDNINWIKQHIRKNHKEILEKFKIVNSNIVNLQFEFRKYLISSNIIKDSIFQIERHVNILFSKLTIIEDVKKRMKYLCDSNNDIKKTVLKFGRVSVHVCKQFVLDELAAEVLNGINFDEITYFGEIATFADVLRQDKGSLKNVDLPKYIKGDVGEYYVQIFLKMVFKNNSIINQSRKHSHPDLEFILDNGSMICIEVKNWHIDVDQTNLAKFYKYALRDEYKGGILLNIGKGNIYGKQSQFEVSKINNKPIIFLSGLNYDLHMLYYAIKTITKLTP